MSDTADGINTAKGEFREGMTFDEWWDARGFEFGYDSIEAAHTASREAWMACIALAPEAPAEAPKEEAKATAWAVKDRERFLQKIVAVKMECGNAVGNARRSRFDQGAKWLGLRIQKLINETGEPQPPAIPEGGKE